MGRFFLALALFSSFAQAALPLKLTTYNVENLFDWTHDEGKQDYSFLPLATKRASSEVQAYCKAQPQAYQDECFNLDWSETAVRQKITNLAGVIRATHAGGPDVVFIQEVENIHVLTLLAQAVGADYKAYLIEGPDERGIDVGLITRLKVDSLDYHTFDIPSGRKTRGILEAHFTLKGETKVALLGNHWPSQSNPDEDRMVAAQNLAHIAQAAAASADLVVAAGDFNTADDDVHNGIREVLLPLFFDAETEARAHGIQLFPGTYNFRGNWGSLDHIFVLKAKAAPMGLDWSGVFIPNKGLLETQMWNGKPEERPRRFDVKTGQGFSDHLPFVMAL